VIRNLVSNGIKFTTSGGTVAVFVRWCKDGLPDVVFSESDLPRAGSLVLEVVDSGAGMSLENQANLFKEGMQFNANQLQAGGGSGLGLWIAKGFVDLHQGLLSAHSEGEGQGTIFRLELPLLQSEETVGTYSADEESRASQSGADTKAGPSMSAVSVRLRPVEKDKSVVKTVMVVDDSAPSNKVVCRLLRNSGYICHQAVDGQDCLDVFEQLSSTGVVIDLILMDFEMPRMNGPSATQELRKRGVTIPIIGVTGNVLQADTDCFVDHGANLVLHKPLSVEKLESFIADLNSSLVHKGRAVLTMNGVDDEEKSDKFYE
jgi:CheY-like chemotaxis protein